MLDASANAVFPRSNRGAALAAVLRPLLTRPALLWQGVKWLGRRLWRMRRDLLAARGRVHKLSFFVHNFMDAAALDPARVDACSFMVATSQGPVSMCRHNAMRDDYLLAPVRMAQIGWWNPVTGTMQDEPVRAGPVRLSPKTARGRARLRSKAA